MDTPVISIQFVPASCKAKFGQSDLLFIFLSFGSKQLCSKISSLLQGRNEEVDRNHRATVIETFHFKVSGLCSEPCKVGKTRMQEMLCLGENQTRANSALIQFSMSQMSVLSCWVTHLMLFYRVLLSMPIVNILHCIQWLNLIWETLPYPQWLSSKMHKFYFFSDTEIFKLFPLQRISFFL